MVYLVWANGVVIPFAGLTATTIAWLVGYWDSIQSVRFRWFPAILLNLVRLGPGVNPAQLHSLHPPAVS